MDDWGALGPPPPADEICACEAVTGVLLCYALTANPLRCARCHGEVAPARIGLTEDLVERVARWRDRYGVPYGLWLASGADEEAARRVLTAPTHPVNEEGRSLAAELPLPAWLWWFVDPEADPERAPSACPVCAGSLQQRARGRACDRCRVFVPSDEA